MMREDRIPGVPRVDAATVQLYATPFGIHRSGRTNFKQPLQFSAGPQCQLIQCCLGDGRVGMTQR